MRRFEAVVFREYGDPSVLHSEQFERPLPRLGYALVETRATTVNNVDLQLRSGRLGTHRPLPHALGPDVVGTVVSAPDESWIGRRVAIDPSLGCGRCRWCLAGERNACSKFQILGEDSLWGGYSSLVECPTANLIELPDSLPWDIAACLPVTFGTTWRMLNGLARVTAADRVLVIGAAGGIAVAARRVSRLLGAETHVLARPSAKLDRVASEGFPIWPCPLEAVGSMHKTLRAAGGFSVIVDSAGGAWFTLAVKSLETRGRLVTCGSTVEPTVPFDIRQVFWKQLSIMGATGGSAADIATVLMLAARGALAPEIARGVDVRDASSAHAAVAAGEVFGKVVLSW